MALVLLNALAVSCIPPDFTVESGANKPVSIDRQKLRVSPEDGVQTLSGCPLTLDFDVAAAVVNPDLDRLRSAWFVNDVSVDYSNSNGITAFPFDACVLGPRPTNGIYEVKLIVVDRDPKSLKSVADIMTFIEPDTTYAAIVWTVWVEDTTCCDGGGL